MTASKTPRLGLMSPVGSDAFITTDFSQTFGILDANPGMAVVANAASRPTTYTTAQHGSMVFQTDLAVIWFWNQPTSGSVGAWSRVGNKGLLSQTTQAAGTITATTTNYASGTQVVTNAVTAPGGRALLVMASWGTLGNSNGNNVVSIWESTNRLADRFFYGYNSDKTGGSGMTQFVVSPPTTQTNYNFRMTIAAFNDSPPDGGGTTRITGGVLTVFEL